MEEGVNQTFGHSDFFSDRAYNNQTATYIGSSGERLWKQAELGVQHSEIEVELDWQLNC